MLVRFFPRVSILSGEKMDKERMCTTNSLDFTTEIKNVHCFGLTLTYKNSGKSDKYRCNGGYGWRKEPKLPAMDDNVGVGKIRNCGTINYRHCLRVRYRTPRLRGCFVVNNVLCQHATIGLVFDSGLILSAYLVLSFLVLKPSHWQTVL